MKQLIYDVITGLSIAAIAIYLALQADFNKTLVERTEAAEQAAIKAELKDSTLHAHFSRCAFVAIEDVQFISVGSKSHSCNCR